VQAVLNLFDKISGLAKLRQYDLAHSIIPTHNFVSDACKPTPVLTVQVLFRAIQDMRDTQFVDSSLVTQRLNRRDVKPVSDFVDGISHLNAERSNKGQILNA
jgi:hypothetical protein